MKPAEFLFPKDLEVSASGIRRLLIVGSCLSEFYVRAFREANPEIVFDFVLFNNAADLPTKTDAELAVYDFQYIQIPLRSVLTDAVIRIADSDRSKQPIDWLALGKQHLDMMLESAMTYSVQTGLVTLVANFIVPQQSMAPSLRDQGGEQDLITVIRGLNAYLASSIRQYAHAYLADVDMISNSLGKKYFLDDVISFSTHGAMFFTDWSGHENWPAWTAPDAGRLETIRDLGNTYENKNEEFFSAVFRQMEALHRTVRQLDMVKVVIFDLDNTMWRGQLVEHYQSGFEWPYADGWPLGIWETVHHLRRRGIVVTLASKNDQSLVASKWQDAVSPPFVNFDDFLSPKINWQPKAENIVSILRELSLTAKSAVFVDDNPIERESVKSLIPGIRVIGADPFVVRRILLWSPETQIATRTDESIRREDMLKKQAEREREKSSLSRDDFLKSLNSKAEIRQIGSADHPLFSRVFELVNKTNQFNTTGVRWSTDAYQRYFSMQGKIFAFSVKDRFVDYGTVGVVFVLEKEITQFVMSCRVLGMEIETAVLNAVIEKIRQGRPSVSIHARLEITESNTPCRTLYSNSGFSAAGPNQFTLESQSLPKSADHVDVQILT